MDLSRHFTNEKIQMTDVQILPGSLRRDAAFWSEEGEEADRNDC